MEFTITKDKVLEAASISERSKELLRILFPEAFTRDKSVSTTISDLEVDTSFSISNLYIRNKETGQLLIVTGDGLAPEGLKTKCFYLGHGFNWEKRGNLLIPTRK